MYFYPSQSIFNFTSIFPHYLTIHCVSKEYFNAGGKHFVKKSPEQDITSSLATIIKQSSF